MCEIMSGTDNFNDIFEIDLKHITQEPSDKC